MRKVGRGMRPRASGMHPDASVLEEEAPDIKKPTQGMQNPRTFLMQIAFETHPGDLLTEKLAAGARKFLPALHHGSRGRFLADFGGIDRRCAYG